MRYNFFTIYNFIKYFRCLHVSIEEYQERKKYSMDSLLYIITTTGVARNFKDEKKSIK